jgi:hypothetical protein
MEPITGASRSPGIEVMVTRRPALVAEPVSSRASHGNAIKTAEPAATLNRFAIWLRIKGTFVATSLVEAKVFKTYC